MLDTGGMSRSLGPLLLQNMSPPNNCCTHLILLTPCTFRPRTLCTPLHRGPSSPRCRCSSSTLSSPQASRSLLDRHGTRLFLSTACTFLPRTLCSCLRPAPRSPHYKYRMSYLQTSWSLMDSPCTMPQRTFLAARRTCPRHSPGKSNLLKPLLLQNTSQARTPCSGPIQ